MRFAFDLGSGSLGWAVYRLNAEGSPCELVGLGARIFPTGRDPQSKESSAAGRRQPRQQRRQIDRRNKRRAEVEDALVRHGLMPERGDVRARAAFFAIDPYCARGRCAAGTGTREEVGRAIWHIAKHRGFKSNRKADRANENETGAIASGAASLREQLIEAGAPTIGAWLAERHERGQPVRVRPTALDAEAIYDFYPTRDLLEAEFNRIWALQAPRLPELTDAAREDLHDATFFQRSLQPVQPGRCTFFPAEERLPKWHPLAQAFLILQQLNMIRIIRGASEQALQMHERDLIFQHLMDGQKLSWTELRRLLKLPSDTDINLEKGGLKELAYNAVAARLCGSAKKPGPLRDFWPAWSDAERLHVLSILDQATTPEEAVGRLSGECGLPAETASQVEKINLPDGHLMLGERAVRAIAAVLREEVVVYSEAVRQASERGLFGDGAVVHHSDLRQNGDPGLERLPPYYQLPVLRQMIGTGTGNPDDPPALRFGQVQNPTVHIGLGQFRRVMNALIEAYGPPTQVVIEAARDMAKSARELNEIEAEIRKNTKRNDAWRAELEEAKLLLPRQRPGDRLLRMRLWEELGRSPADRLCPYTGRPISLTDLQSDRIEVDHILPFEDTFDDSPANLTVCFRDANRFKGKRAPGDAWEGAELEAIIARVKASPGMSKKLWRFLPGALEKWQETRGFEDRQLHATGHLARIVRAYAEALFPKDGTSSVWMTNGRMTALLRRRWGLHLPDHNQKTRDDHRHHAIDAAVVGAVDRRMVQILQNYARRVGADRLDRILPDPPEPFPGFRDQVIGMVAKVLVSHRPNHAVSGRLMEDTAYGQVRELPDNKKALEIGNLVRRKPVISLTPAEINAVRDEALRTSLVAATCDLLADKTPDKKALAERLAQWSSQTGHRTIRVLTQNATAQPIRGRPGKPREGEPYKWMIPAENAFLDILEGPDGRWFRHGTNLWDAASGRAPAWQEVHPESRFIMRLFKGDTIQLFDWDDKVKAIVPGTNKIFLVTSIPNSDTNNYVRIQPVNDATNGRSTTAAFESLRKRRARRVRIDEIGRVRTIPHGVI